MDSYKLKVERVRNAIATFPGFPKPGINFKDIFPILQDPAILSDLIDIMCEHVQSLGADVVVGLEARGFLFGPLISLRLKLPFVPIRKKGKLPGDTVQVSYQLEYGTDVFEAQVGSIKPGQKVVLVDDLLATGGTLNAACQLVSKMQGISVGCLVIIELKELNGKAKVPIKVHSILDISEHD